MSTATLTNARRTLRDALHRRVRGVEDWSHPSMAVFRNHLLDDVGSDARPLTNLLLEAVDRGVLDSLPRERVTPALWTARCTSLVMQWVGERFVQPEAARWAVESWAYAMGTIEASQLTVLPDAAHNGADASGSSANGVHHQRGGASNSYAPPVSASALPPAPRQPTPRPAGRGRPPSAAAQTAWRAPASSGLAVTNTGRAVAYARPVPARAPLPPRQISRFWPEPINNPVGRISSVLLVAIIGFIGVNIARGPDSALARPLASAQGQSAGSSGGMSGNSRGNSRGNSSERIGMAESDNTPRSANSFAADSAMLADAMGGNDFTNAPRSDSASGFAGNSTAPGSPNDGIGVGGQSTRVPLAPGSGFAPSLAMTRLPAQGATPGEYQELAERSNMRALREGAGTARNSAGANPNSPGVPGITRNALPLNDNDVNRVRRVTPATRPPQRSVQPPARTNAGVSASASQRSAAPGLDELRLESGRRLQGRVEVIRASSVVFRDATTGLRYEFLKNDIDEIITEFGNPVRFRERGGAKPGSTGDRRMRSVAGKYEVRYDAARINGSAACRDLWRGPSGSDIATIAHRAGDDTLSVAFEGGDTFPSVLDNDGFFNSTFRIMPGQAELATALTTRLSGWIAPGGELALQVNVIGYRRVQGTSGVSCHIIVDATGTRTP